MNVIISYGYPFYRKKGIVPSKWIKPVIIFSIPWAVSIYTVTTFLYSCLATRPFWYAAIIASRFLATAFAAIPALLILFVLILRRNTKFDPSEQAIQNLATIVTYAMVLNIFFFLLKLFTALHGGITNILYIFNYFILDWKAIGFLSLGCGLR